VVIERESVPGGAARSFERDGFTFDITGHWLHLRDAHVRSLVEKLLPGELVSIERRAEVHLDRVRTPYPFQANTYGRPASLIAECLLGYFAAREAEARGEHPPPETFADYIHQQMGAGVARHFMIPYNTKLWTVDPRELSFAWCRRFVPIPTPEEMVRGALEPNANAALGYNTRFLYPRRGGIARLPGALAGVLQVPVHYNDPAVAIDWREQTVRTSSGRLLRYQHLVSTMPLPDLAGLLRDAPTAVIEAAAALRATSVTYWDVGLAGKNRPGSPHWIYFPEPNLPFYRVGSASAVASALAPPDHRSYYVEVSHPRGTPCPAGDTEVLSGLRRVGLLGAQQEPVTLERSTVDCAYVIMDAAYGGARSTLHEWLAEQHILSVGRYGDWTYDSMEGALIQGRDAAIRVRELCA
jgi:protoporphyrinogen oxidase